MEAYSKTAVICINHNNDTIAELYAAGFGCVLHPHVGETLRNTFARAAAEGFAYIVAYDTRDGYTAADAALVTDALAQDESALIVGTRQCEKETGLPAKLFGFLSGLHATDINASLLGMTAVTCQTMLRMKSNDHNFLYNIPLEARANDIAVREVPTHCMHSNPPGWDILTRSFKLYYVFIKFSIAAFIAYLVDIGTFYLFQRLFHGLADEYKILCATVLSRLLCSIATYILNRGAVFKSQNKTAGAVLRFIILSVAQLVASWLLVWGLGTLLGGGDALNTAIKVVVDLVIFIASFTIQRDWVFKKTDGLLW